MPQLQDLAWQGLVRFGAQLLAEGVIAANEVMLTRQELETPRTAAEILEWVNAAGHRLSATPELRAAARRGELGAKELWEEARPIALFAHRYFAASPLVTIKHVIGNQSHDATVQDCRTTPSNVRFIEVTVSNENYQESLRRELLTRDGSAPAYTEVYAEGPRGNRTLLAAAHIAVNHDELRERHIDLMVAAARRKMANQYQQGTALVVRIDDYGPFREDEDVEELDEVARTAVVPVCSGREFCVLALEGSRAVHLAYELQMR